MTAETLETAPPQQSTKMEFWLALAALAVAEQQEPLGEFQAGSLSLPEWLDRAVPLLLARLILATRSGDLFASRDLSSLTSHQNAALPSGLLPPGETEPRLTAALSTIATAEPAQISMRVERLASAETLSAGQQAYSQALTGHGETWVRIADADSCARCRARDGEIGSGDTPASVHPSCHCDIELHTEETP